MSRDGGTSSNHRALVVSCAWSHWIIAFADDDTRCMGCEMSDIDQLEQEILGAVAAAPDEAALEAVRVAALGKRGSISELLKTLGAMTAEERKVQGPRINGLKERATEAIAARRRALKDAALEARLNSETV